MNVKKSMLIRQTFLQGSWHRLAILVGLFFILSVGFSQITATVDKTELTTNDIVQFTVTVTGAGVGQAFDMANLTTDFKVLNSTMQTSISLINGNMTSQNIYTYNFQPVRAGELIIPAINTTIGGVSYATDPITLNVTEGQKATSAGNDLFFVEASVDNLTPYVGQQIIYTFKFFYGSRVVGTPDYQAPDFAGFWGESALDQNQDREVRNGRRYDIVALRKAIYPTRSGKITIAPGVLNISPTMLSSAMSLAAEAIEVDVKPLPTPVPDTFSGAVGQFAMSAFAETDTITQGTPLTIEVFINGEGNISTLPKPIAPTLNEWRVQFEDEAFNLNMEDARVFGDKTFRYSLLAETPGRLTLPPFRYTYFDPKSESYQELESDSFTLTVIATPQANTQNVPTTPANIQGTVPAAQSSTQLTTQTLTQTTSIVGLPLRPPKDDLFVINAAEAQLVTSQPWFWLLWLLSPLLVLAAWWRRRPQVFSAERQGFLQARDKALELLEPSTSKGKNDKRKDMQDTTEEDTSESLLTERQIANVMTNYLDAKLHISSQGMTKAALNTSLLEHGVDSALSTKVISFLKYLDEVNFAPNQANVVSSENDIIEQAKELITKLDVIIQWQQPADESANNVSLATGDGSQVGARL